MNHIFVDFENVHQIDLSVFGSKGLFLTLLMGARQTKLDAALVEKLMEHAASVQLVRLTSSGRNALDFALAYYLGRAAMSDPTAHFHIVSRDTGFEPLIEHLRTRNIDVHRHDDFSGLIGAAPAKPPPAPPGDLMSRVLDHLRRNTTNRPKRKKTLVSHLRALLGKSAKEADFPDLVERLCRAGHLTIGDKDTVTYQV